MNEGVWYRMNWKYAITCTVELWMVRAVGPTVEMKHQLVVWDTRLIDIKFDNVTNKFEDVTNKFDDITDIFGGVTN